MPELPEVETVRRAVEPLLCGRRIDLARVYERRLRWPVEPDFEKRLSGRTVQGIGRRGKYLLFDLDGEQLILHLGMSGRLFLLPAHAPVLRHDHVDLQFDNDLLLRLHDPRRFGAALLWSDAPAVHPLLASLGPEPLSAAFTAPHLFNRSRGRRVAVKNFLMDGRTVVGIGNIYAGEALYRAGIRPRRGAGRVSLREYHALHGAVVDVLREAIASGGTTLRDSSFVGVRGELGYFARQLAVYDRSGQPCRHCGTSIRRVVIGQRSSFFCPTCQR